MTSSDAAVVLIIFSFAAVSVDRVRPDAATLHHTARVVHAGGSQVAAVMAMIDTVLVAKGSEAEFAVDRLDKALGELGILAHAIRMESAEMQKQGEDFYRQWDQELALLKDESVSRWSAAHKQVVRSQWSKLRADYVKTGTDVSSLVAALRHLRALHGQDISSQRQAEVNMLIAAVDEKARCLQKSFAELDGRFEALGLEFVVVEPSRVPR